MSTNDTEAKLPTLSEIEAELRAIATRLGSDEKSDELTPAHRELLARAVLLKAVCKALLRYEDERPGGAHVAFRFDVSGAGLDEGHMDGPNGGRFK